jgi:hypothetical protein
MRRAPTRSFPSRSIYAKSDSNLHYVLGEDFNNHADCQLFGCPALDLTSKNSLDM